MIRKVRTLRLGKVAFPVDPSRTLSRDLLWFLHEGQPDVPRNLKFGVSRADIDFGLQPTSEPPGVTPVELEILANWRLEGVDDSGLQSTPPYSRQLAELLPAGHPLRQIHDFKDAKEDRVNWVLGDPDLDESQRNFIRGIYFEEDDRTRAMKWPLLVDLLAGERLGWRAWRSELREATTHPIEEFLYSLHPRQTIVLTTVASQLKSHVWPTKAFGDAPRLRDVGVEDLVEKFVTSAAEIEEIFYTAFRQLVSEFSGEMNRTYLWLHNLFAVPIKELAGITRDLSRDLIVTRVLLLGVPCQFSISTENTVAVLPERFGWDKP